MLDSKSSAILGCGRNNFCRKLSLIACLSFKAWLGPVGWAHGGLLHQSRRGFGVQGHELSACSTLRVEEKHLQTKLFNAMRTDSISFQHFVHALPRLWFPKLRKPMTKKERQKLKVKSGHLKVSIQKIRADGSVSVPYP